MVGKKSLRLPKDHHPLGKISLHQVVQKSSNRGAAQVGLSLGANRLYDYSKAFGFGEKTNIGLVGERSGYCIIQKTGMGYHYETTDGTCCIRYTYASTLCDECNC